MTILYNDRCAMLWTITVLKLKLLLIALNDMASYHVIVQSVMKCIKLTGMKNTSVIMPDGYRCSKTPFLQTNVLFETFYKN